MITIPPNTLQDKLNTLRSLCLPADLFSEATGGGRVTGACLMTSAHAPSRQYVDVHGSIDPVDPQSFSIEFEVLLPLSWNGRTLQLGGGANCGQIPALHGEPVLGEEIPIDMGYVVYGDDSGHQSEDAMSADFAANDEALRNYIRLHLIKAHEAMLHIVKAFYGTAPDFNYFAGGSAGGREAMECAIHYGEHYDGIFCACPVSNFVLTRLWGAILSRAVYKNYDPVSHPCSDGFIDEATIAAIQKEAIERYDELDGIRDGIVSNIYAARAARDAFREEIRLRYHLTQAQMDTLAVYEEGYTLEYAMANGMKAYHGYSALEGGAMDLGPDPIPREPLDTRYNVHHGDRSDGMFKYFIMKDPTWVLIDHDYFHPDEKLLEALLRASQEYDVNGAELDRFISHGGKLILFTGWSDMSCSPWQAAQQYLGYVDKYGQARVDDFCRFFTMPGVGHCVGAKIPYLTWLDAWCTTGIFPQEGTDALMLMTQGRMPMARYPGWVQYVAGDPKLSSSYRVSYDVPEGFFGRFD